MLSLYTHNAATLKNWNSRHWVISVIDYLIMISICHPLILLSILSVLFAPVDSRGTRGRAVSGAGGFIPAKEKITLPPAQRGRLSCSRRKKEIAKYSNERKRKMKETKSEGRNRGVSKAFVPRLRQKNSKWHRRPSTVRRAVRCGECFSWNRSPLPSFFWRIRLVISNPL